MDMLLAILIALLFPAKVEYTTPRGYLDCGFDHGVYVCTKEKPNEIVGK